MFKRIPGTKDILPADIAGWQEFERISDAVFKRYHYSEIRPPLLEEARLFDRSLGESAEIVQKQMFLIRHGEDVYALRPEGTASIVRAYIENNLDKTQGLVKLYYRGPMFRCERPQKGRLRQFHHIGCEVIGTSSPEADVEVISLAAELLRAFGIKDATLQLNSLGCAQDKKQLAQALRTQLEPQRPKLCEECQVRFDKNVLRILDCKNETCRQIVAGLKLGDSYLCAECREHFGRVRAGLDALKVSYEVSPHLVRGLDYYTRTVFEFKHAGLGAQDAIGAGGRYDNLVQELGGPQAGAIGFAFGVERLMLAAPSVAAGMGGCTVYVATMGDAARSEGVTVLHELRTAGITADMDYAGKSLKGTMRAANDAGARYVVIIGDDELHNRTVTLKDMAHQEQRQVARQDLIKELKSSC